MTFTQCCELAVSAPLGGITSASQVSPAAGFHRALGAAYRFHHWLCEVSSYSDVWLNQTRLFPDFWILYHFALDTSLSRSEAISGLLGMCYLQKMLMIFARNVFLSPIRGDRMMQNTRREQRCWSVSFSVKQGRNFCSNNCYYIISLCTGVGKPGSWDFKIPGAGCGERS